MTRFKPAEKFILMAVAAALTLAAAFTAAGIVACSPFGRAVRLRFPLSAKGRGPEFEEPDSYDEPVPAWLRP